MSPVRRQAEAKTAELESLYEDLYENAPPNIYLSIDAATAKVIRCNETAVRTLGSSREELLGRAVLFTVAGAEKHTTPVVPVA